MLRIFWGGGLERTLEDWRGRKRIGEDKDVMRAFTVKPVWGWLIMKGIKDVENRWNGVQPPKGVCAVSFSKTYGRAEHEELLEYVDRKNRKLIPPFEELKKLCGKVVGIVGYEVRTSHERDS